MSAIRIYCVTVPGSARHREMKAHLESLGASYEFVYGYPMKDVPAMHMKYAKHAQEAVHNGDEVSARKAINGFSCRMAMLAANEKFLDDRSAWGLIIQDDIRLPETWEEQSIWNIDNCPKAGHSIAVCQHPNFPPNGEWKVTEKDHTYTETAMLVSRDYAKANVRALREAPTISDYCFFRMYKESRCFRSPMPFAHYMGTVSYIQNMKPSPAQP